jgi:hypothetical protein
LSAAACDRESAEIREARGAAASFVSALKSGDAARLRAMATCAVSSEGVRDARLRYFEPSRRVTLSQLDSLLAVYAEEHRRADSLYASAPDSASNLEAHFERARDFGRRSAITRAARRAAERSVTPEPTTSAAARSAPAAATLRTVRAHLLVRFAGPAVGPSPIDRDTILRLLRAPGGTWVVYAWDPAADVPPPLPY